MYSCAHTYTHTGGFCDNKDPGVGAVCRDNSAHLNYLKMMRLLFLCLLLLLPAAAAVSEDTEGSADDDVINDDEDYVRKNVPGLHAPGSAVDKTTGADESSNQFTLIVIVVAVTVLALSIAAIVAIILIRRKTHSRQQGIYSVPTEQDQKGAI